jgi:hypothetical protein
VSKDKQRKRQPHWAYWIPLVITVGLLLREASQGLNEVELIGHAITNLLLYGILFGFIGAAFRVPVEDD